MSISTFLREDKGSVLINVAFSATVLFGATGLAIDFGHLRMMQKELQVTADSSALAASAMIVDRPAATQIALDYSTQNMPVSRHGAVLNENDIEFGEWDEVLRTFQPTTVAADINAVRVTTRRSAANNNPVTFSLGQLLGFINQDLTASAVAMLMPADCFNAGGTAGGKVIFGQDASLSGFCMYGREGVKFGQDALIENGAQIGALSLDRIIFGQNAIYPDDALIVIDKLPERSYDLEAYINDIESGTTTVPGMTNVVSGSDLPDILVEGTVYIVDQSININKYNMAKNVLILVRGNIQFGQDASLVNTGDIDTGDVSLGVIATGDVKFGQDGVISGVDIVAGKDIVIGQDIGAFSASFTAGDNIHIGQNAKLDFNPYDPAIRNATPNQAAVLVQ